MGPRRYISRVGAEIFLLSAAAGLDVDGRSAVNCAFPSSLSLIMASEIRLAFCTCPDETIADRLAGALVERKFAACVNIVPTVRSIYRWQGRIEQDQEALLLIKFAAHRFQDLRDTVLDLHPYDTPELVVVDVGDGAPDYLNWVLQSCADDTSG